MIKILVYLNDPEREHFYHSLNDSCVDLRFILPESKTDFFSKQIDQINPDVIVSGNNEVFSLDKKEFDNIFTLVRKIKFVIEIHESEINRTVRILRSGGKGVILRNDEKEVVCECMATLMIYDGFISPMIVSKMVGYNDHLLQVGRSLSNSENLVVAKMMEGSSDKMIASEMDLSYHTIKTHRKHIFKKFKINSLGEFFKMMR